MNRTEHLQWCKDRALEYCDKGDIQQAFSSMASDLMKHPETQMHKSTIALGMKMVIGGHLRAIPEMQRFINGFN